jgi:hypothetical protein
MNDVTRRAGVTTRQIHHELITLFTNTPPASRALTREPAKNDQTRNTVDAMDELDILVGEGFEFEDYIDADAAEESNDDGIESFAGTDFVDELYTNASDLDENGGRPVIAAKNQFKIDHSSGSFRMKRQYPCYPVQLLY